MVSESINHQFVLRRRPSGMVTDDCFELVTASVRGLASGEVLVRTLWLSFDPAQRGWLNDMASYVPPVGIGEVMRAWGVGEVVASTADAYQTGDLVTGWWGWQRYCIADASDEYAGISRVPAGVGDPKLAIGVAGLSGLSAYFGMIDIGRPGPGDTVLVTAAAGGTGSVAGQIARLLGAERVIGTAGNDEKCSWVREVAGFDDCVLHYDDQVRHVLREQAPEGYDVVFDNVGGALLDAGLFNIAHGGRVVLCGSIATGYEFGRPEVGLHYYQLLNARRARMEGFIVLDYVDRFGAARADLLNWVSWGDLRTTETVIEGLENAPRGLRDLFGGKNLGKQLLHVADPVPYGG